MSFDIIYLLLTSYDAKTMAGFVYSNFRLQLLVYFIFFHFQSSLAVAG